MNRELAGVLHIARGHESHSHMWNADTLQDYLEFLKTEVKRKRLSLGLSFSVKGLILCDAATVHSSAIYERIRERFQTEANCILLHGGSSCLSEHGVQIPGGWGATGAPNDSWHQFFHLLRKGYQSMCTGMSASLKLRKSMDELGMGIDGNSRFSCLCV